MFHRVLLTFCFILSYFHGITQTLPIIPQPHSVIEGLGHFNLNPGDSFTLHYTTQIKDKLVSANAFTLLTQSLSRTGMPCKLEENMAPTFRFVLRRNHALHADNAASNFVLPKEGYWLKILPDEILGQADDAAGFLYAVQSLRQLLHGQAKVFDRIDCVTIIDHPNFEFRGIMDDISRGPLSTLTFMKQQVERLSYYKLNVFGFYIEHVLRTKAHPNFSPVDGLTPEELVELSDYARKFNVTTLGSFQSLGHFRNILAAPAYQSLGVSDRMLIPGDSAALQFLYDVYDEVTPSFSNSIFNINCDEVYDLSRSYLKPIAETHGEAHLFLSHIRPLLEKVSELGKRPAMWGDMLVKFPSILSEIPKETMVFAWDYTANSDFSKWTKPLASAGLDFIACPGIVNSYKLWPDHQLTQSNIRRFSCFAFENKAKGIFTTVWDDGGRHFFQCDWLGIAYAGAYSWLPDSNLHSEFSPHYDLIHFQDTTKTFTRIMNELSAMKSIGALSKLNTNLLELNYGSSGSLVECIDTSGFTEIKIRATEVLDLFAQLRNQGNHESSSHELDIWKFKIDELLLNLKTAETLLNMDFEMKGRSNMINLNALVSKWEEKAHKFAILWASENRDYWLDQAQELYLEKAGVLRKWVSFLRRHIQQSDSQLQGEFNHSSLKVCGGQTLLYWLGAGPFDGSQGIDYDYLKLNGGEAHIQPSAIHYFRNQRGEDQGWKKIISTRPGLLNFDDFYDAVPSSIAYASATIDSKKSTKVSAQIQGLSPFELFVNGDKILSDSSGNLKSIPMELIEGRNYILIKSLRTSSRKWSFAFRILGQQIEQNKYRYYIK